MSLFRKRCPYCSQPLSFRKLLGVDPGDESQRGVVGQGFEIDGLIEKLHACVQPMNLAA